MPLFNDGESGASVRAKLNAAISTVDALNTGDNLLMSAAERAKLAAVEAGATADMSAAEVKTAYESNADTNAFTDAEKAKLAAAAPLASPALTGTPTAPTAAPGTNTTQIATAAFVQAAIAALVASSPVALDTLNELAAALGNDENFAATMTTALAGKAAAVHNHTAAEISDASATGRSMLTGDATTNTALLNVFTSTLKGLAPASGGGTTNFLRADGTWAAPPGGGGSNPVIVGSGVPATAPASIGLLYIDDSNYNLYYSVGSATVSDWVLVIDNDAGVTLGSKATPVLADEVMLYDSENSSQAATATWTQIIAALRLVTLDASNRLVNPKAIYTSFDGGTPSAASTYTPAAADGNVQHIINNAAFTLAPPATLGSFAIEIVNGATAGAITTSGFTKVSGDALTTTNGHKFIAQIVKTNSVSHLNITAMQ